MMPQLHDSGAHSLHTTEPIPSAEMDGFCCIFDIEARYGVVVTGAERPVDADQVAMTTFQPIVFRSHSTSTHLANGSRLYLDVGSHPEYATAEARDPCEALAQDLADEHVIRDLVLKAQHKLRESYGVRATIYVSKNNVDSTGHAFDCHENYLVRRFAPLEAIERQLLSLLITRRLYIGAGRMTPGNFQITQRADFLNETVSSATTRSRPMVGTHDEPHADPDSFRRLHMITGDSSRSQWSMWIKLTVTHLILCAIEDALHHGIPSGFEQYAFADPAAASRTVNRFLDNPYAELTLESGESVSALGLQCRYYATIKAFIETHDDALADSLPATTIDTVMGEWNRVLGALERGAYDVLADHVDWAAKKRLLDALKRHRPDATFAQIEQLELDCHDIINGRLYGSLVARNQVRELLTRDNVKYAVYSPPTDTRAALRGRLVDTALNVEAQPSADWTHLTLTALERREAILLGPFEAEPTLGFEQLVGALN